MTLKKSFSISKDNIISSSLELEKILEDFFNFKSDQALSLEEVSNGIQNFVNAIVEENHVTGEIHFKVSLNDSLSFVIIPISHGIFIPIYFMDSFFDRKQNPLRLLPETSNRNIEYMVTLGAKQLVAIFVMNCTMVQFGKAMPAIYEGFVKTRFKELVNNSIGICSIGRVSSKSILTRTISNATKSVKLFSIVLSLSAVEMELNRKLKNIPF